MSVRRCPSIVRGTTRVGRVGLEPTTTGFLDRVSHGIEHRHLGRMHKVVKRRRHPMLLELAASAHGHTRSPVIKPGPEIVA